MTTPGAGTAIRTTATGLLREALRTEPDRVLLRRRDRGLWLDVSVAEMATGVARCTAALHERGVVAGSSVHVRLPVGLDWICCDLALEAIGAHGIHQAPTDPIDGHDTGLVVVAPESATRVSRFAEHVMSTADWPDDAPSFPEQSQVCSFRRFVAAGSPVPSAADAARAIAELLVERIGPDAQHRTLAQFPRPTMVDWASIVFVPLAVTGVVGHLPDWSESIDDAFHEVEPTLVVSPAAEWAALAAAVDESLASAGWLKRESFRAAHTVLRIDAVTTRVLRRRVGLGAARRALSYGEPDANTAARWRAWRLPLEVIPIDGPRAGGSEETDRPATSSEPVESAIPPTRPPHLTEARPMSKERA
jgi:hypothetical protein